MILDVGCGNGGLVTQLLDKGYSKAMGVDAYVKPLDPRLTSLLSRANFSYDRLPYSDALFDTVCSFEVFEHLENPRHMVREIFRVTKPNGVVIISVPNILSIFNRLTFLKNGEMYRYNKNNDHWSMFPKNIFEKTFLPYFDLVETVYLKGYFPYGRLSRIPLPENKYFGRSVAWVFKRRETHIFPMYVE